MINLRVKGKLVIYQFRTQKSIHKKMICYYKNLISWFANNRENEEQIAKMENNTKMGFFFAKQGLNLKGE